MSSPRPKYVPVVGPRLKRLLAVVFGLFALLVLNSVYLVSITVAGPEYQDRFYQWMFFAHLAMGFAIVVPVIVFGAIHIRNARNRPNKRAIRAGYALFAVALLVFASGLVLTRLDAFGVTLHVAEPLVRKTAYWLHVTLPLLAIWLFVLHRLAGRRIKWRIGVAWAVVAVGFAVVMAVIQMQDPRTWNRPGPESGMQYFFPSLARTSTGNFIPAEVLDNDAYCLECHADIHDSWSHSVHRFSSFNNPPYLFSVRNTREKLAHPDVPDEMKQGARFCAGCHDPVPFFSGSFDDPKWDDPEYDLASDPLADAGITCTVCHAITHVNSVRGNADYTIEEPLHYPFAFSDNAFLKWVNRQLIKAKPEFHKATFLKPLHREPEFCSGCHKVHLPPELNGYKWLRGQNHHDSFWLSGVSGHGVTSWYYPPQAQTNCNGCHMPARELSGLGGRNLAAKSREPGAPLTVLDHQFPSANAAIPYLRRDALRDADAAIAAHQEFIENSVRVDIFGIRREGRIDGELVAPLRPEVPTLVPGETYLLETVIRTLTLGHHFTQGTADSNEVWLDVTVRSGDRVIGRSGGMHERDRSVDPWSHFVNAFVLDRDGNRIDRRNAEDIFIPLYNNQIPPGAADTLHYRLRVPEDLDAPITVEARLRYRKFDALYMQLVHGDPDHVNDLPILEIGSDSVTFPVAGVDATVATQERDIPEWQRWNDYGIGLFRNEQLSNSIEAFARVEALGRPEGPLNLARVYIREGLVQTDAPDALARAAAFDPPANAWQLLWFGAQTAVANGDHWRAIDAYEEILRGGFEQAAGRGFDFSKDYRVLNALGNSLYQVGLRERGEQRERTMLEARERYREVLELEPEDLAAHYGLFQVERDLGNEESAAYHQAQHARYKPDDNARDRAIAAARRRYPAADHAAEAVVINDLQRPGAFELPAAAEVAGGPGGEVPDRGISAADPAPREGGADGAGAATAEETEHAGLD